MTEYFKTVEFEGMKLYLRFIPNNPWLSENNSSLIISDIPPIYLQSSHFKADGWHNAPQSYPRSYILNTRNTEDWQFLINEKLREYKDWYDSDKLSSEQRKMKELGFNENFPIDDASGH